MLGPGRLRTLHTLLSLPLCAADCRSCAAVCRAGAERGAPPAAAADGARRPDADGGRSPVAAGWRSPEAVGWRSPLAAGCRSPVGAGCRSPLATGCRSPLAAGCLSPLATGFLSPVAADSAAGCLSADRGAAAGAAAAAGCRSPGPRREAIGTGTGLSSPGGSAGAARMGVTPMLLPLLPTERHGVEVSGRRRAATRRPAAEAPATEDGSPRSGVLDKSGPHGGDGDRCRKGHRSVASRQWQHEVDRGSRVTAL